MLNFFLPRNDQAFYGGEGKIIGFNCLMGLCNVVFLNFGGKLSVFNFLGVKHFHPPLDVYAILVPNVL